MQVFVGGIKFQHRIKFTVPGKLAGPLPQGTNKSF